MCISVIEPLPPKGSVFATTSRKNILVRTNQQVYSRDQDLLFYISFAVHTMGTWHRISDYNFDI